MALCQPVMLLICHAAWKKTSVKPTLYRLIGKSIRVKVIEVNRKRRRLVFSQRDAERGNREARKDKLLSELKEGEVRKGVVSGLRDFGAFVDLGGADGLIHISELAWHRVTHPRDVLNIGDELDVYVLRLDQDGKRIGLESQTSATKPLGDGRRQCTTWGSWLKGLSAGQHHLARLSVLTLVLKRFCTEARLLILYRKTAPI